MRSSLDVLHKEADSSITHKLEFFNLLEIHPLLHPHLSIIYFVLPAISCHQRYVIHGPSHYLLLHICYLLEFQKSILFLVLFSDSETSDIFYLDAVL